MHLLLYMQGVTEETKATIENGLKEGTCSWWHHLDNIWLICLGHRTNTQTFNSWYAWLTPLVAKDKGSFLLMQLTEGNPLNGLLPQPAWAWIQNHLHPHF